MEASEVLNKAADLLEKPGAWGKDTYGVEGQCMCVNGAIMAAEGRPEHDDENSAACKAFAASLGLDHPWDTLRWNDAPERTQAEVVEALRQAARQSSPSSQEAGRG